MEIIGGVLATVVPGLIWWIHHDGPGRMYAQFVAASTADRARRDGALEVLDQTKHLRSREPVAAERTTSAAEPGCTSHPGPADQLSL